MGVWLILAISVRGGSERAGYNAIGLTLILLFVLGVTIVMAVRNRVRNAESDRSPILTVNAKVVSKRSDVDSHMEHDETPAYNSDSPMAYYITFKEDGHGPLEFRVPHDDYYLLAEGDTGRLTYQGFRYESFEKSQDF